MCRTAGAGAYAGCAYCCQIGEHCKLLDKMVYLEHRRFLSSGDALRLDITRFPHKQVCDKEAPMSKTQEYVDRENKAFKSKGFVKEKRGYAQKTGCTGKTPLRKLPHHDRHLNTPVEPMHVIKCISEHVVKLLCGVEDSIKVRAEERARTRFCTAWVPDEGTSHKQSKKSKRVVLPPAPFRLTPTEIKSVNQRLLSIRTPHLIDWKQQPFGAKMHMKSVQWKNLMACGILKYCMRDMLGTLQRKTLIELCDVVSELVSEEIDASQLDTLEYRTNRVLSLVERDFPVSLNVIVFHLLHHLPMFLRRFGPTYTFHMFPFERFNSWITRRVHNRRYPEATVLETYRLFELSAFLSIANLLPQDSVNNSDQQELNDRQTEVLCEDDLQLLQQCYNKCEVESAVSMYTFVMKQDKHGRSIRYSAYTSAAAHSSSIVYSQSKNKFGEISKVFRHTFRGQTNSFARIQWFKQYHKDTAANLLYINSSDTEKPDDIADIQSLSKPLVHSYEDGKLWILNAPL